MNLLNYPKFDQYFDIHTNDIDIQLGVGIFQDENHLHFYSRRLISAQRNYTITEQELLTIVLDTPKHFRHILLGYKINIFTDHKSLVYDSKLKSSQRVMQQETSPKRVWL